MNNYFIKDCYETALGIIVLMLSFLNDFIHEISPALNSITLICGTIIGLHGAYRVVHRIFFTNKIGRRLDDKV